MTVPAPQPLWYKDAVIYQLHVKTFADSNGDGIGDFKGLSSKLDYLADLGVTCLWLLPMYPSPFRDDGYDIADYYSIHPSYGTLDDFREFLDAAHARRLRVVTELVLNHTSDQHAWFKEARSSRDNPRRDWYVWSDTDDRYQRRPHHLRRYRALELGMGPRVQSVLLASVLQPSTGPQLRQPCGPGRDVERDEVLARAWRRRVQGRRRAVSDRAREHHLRGTSRDPRCHQVSADAARCAFPGQDAPGGSEPTS